MPPQPTTPTDRELEALRAYLVSGSVEAAAEALDRSPSTVRNQLASLRRRLRVDTTAQAVAKLGLRV